MVFPSVSVNIKIRKFQLVAPDTVRNVRDARVSEAWVNHAVARETWRYEIIVVLRFTLTAFHSHINPSRAANCAVSVVPNLNLGRVTVIINVRPYRSSCLSERRK